MKIQKNTKNNRFIPIIILTLTVLVIGAIFLFLYINKGSTEKTSLETDGPAESIHKSDDRQAQKLSDNPDTKLQAPNSDKPPAPTVNTDTGKQTVQMTASTNNSNGTVFIRGGANYPVKGGSCYALLSGPSGKSVRKDTTVLQNPASTDCKTISIPVGELSSGKWTFTLNYISDSYEGASDEVSFTL